jgi:hypothetical protein
MAKFEKSIEQPAALQRSCDFLKTPRQKKKSIETPSVVYELHSSTIAFKTAILVHLWQ